MPTTRRAPRSALALVLLVTMLGGATAATAHQGLTQADSPRPAAIGAVRASVSIAADQDPGAGSGVDVSADLRREHLAPRAARPVAAITGVRIGRDTPAPRPRSESRATGTPHAGAAAPTRSSGRNRVWIPSLGIRRSVSFFSCSSNAYPGDRVYRWGCAGRNNIYLFGHAHSVFKPLHDAYVRGRLRKGMEVRYADGDGQLALYRVAWWKVTTPDKGAFAYAAQSRPSMTLQTCVGARSQYRLIVRLVKVG